MRTQTWVTLVAVILVSCQTPPPPSVRETNFRVCLELAEWSGQPGISGWVEKGEVECVDRPDAAAGATTVWSDWAYDSNGYDPDGVTLSVEKRVGGIPSTKLIPQVPDTHISQDLDFRLLIQLNDASGDHGEFRATPWVSEGGGWSPYALDANGYDFDGARIGIETRPAPGLVVFDMRIGVRAADAGGTVEGVPQFSEWLLGAYAFYPNRPGWRTAFAGDTDNYDPDAVSIYLQAMTTAPAVTASDLALCVQVVDQVPAGLFDAGPKECSPYAMSSLGAVWSAWAYDTDQVDPDGVRLYLDQKYPSADFILRDLDVRLLIQVTDAGQGAGEIQATPWASEGAGWSAYALDPNAYDFDGVRVGVETRAAPGLQIDSINVGVRVADQGGNEEGMPRFVHLTLFPDTQYLVLVTDWATDPNQYDPDAVAIYLETTTSTVP